MVEELKQIVLSMLEQHNTMTIATVNQEGNPEAAAVFYVNQGFELFFLSNPDSRHAHNIGNGNRCAITINQDYDSWLEIKGLQIEGEVIPLSNSIAKGMALKYYYTKYGFINEIFTEGHKLFQAFKKAKFYRVKPEIFWITDNTYGFGKRRKLKLDWSTADPSCEIE